jgi:hypothetical protein
VGIPTNIIQVTFALKSFMILLHAMLGSNHPLAREIDNFLRAWTSNEVMLDAALTTPDSTGQIVWYVQLWVSNWFEDQIKSISPVAPPDLCRLLSWIRNSKAWAPALPVQYSRMRAQAPTRLVPN